MAELARFKIGDTIYTTAALDEISLRDLMLFDSQAADMGLKVRWNDIQRVAGEMTDLDDTQAGSHPDALLLTGVTIWAARRSAGEDVTLEQAVDFPLAQLQFLPSTADHRPDPTKARRSQKGSVRAMRDADLDLESSTTETSEPRSASA